MKTLISAFIFIFAFVAVKASDATTGTRATVHASAALNAAGAASDAAIAAPAPTTAEAAAVATPAPAEKAVAATSTNNAKATKLGFFGRMRETAKLYKALKSEMKVMKATEANKTAKSNARLTKTNVILLGALGVLLIILGLILGGGAGIVLATLGVATLALLLILYLI
jgi:hypothetical protein